MGGDTQEWDWEVLVNDSISHGCLNPNSEIEGEGEGEEGERDSSFSDESVIRSDYFSLEFDSHERTETTKTGMDMELEGEKAESESESGSWMDPGQVQFPRNKGKRRRNCYSSSSQSDSDSPIGGRSSDRSGSGEDLLLLLQPHSDCTCHPHQFPDHHHHQQPQLQTGSFSAIGVGIEEEEDEGEKGQQNQLAHSTDTNVNNEEDVDMNENDNNGVIEQAEDDKRGMGTRGVWWRVPLELLKYCVLRVRPVWSLSLAAAAIMGLVLLRRTWLFKMKRKTQQGLRLNVTVDDKKVSQFMSRAARLNEAFSVVKRVPIIRPSLPAPGLASWPVISMR